MFLNFRNLRYYSKKFFFLFFFSFLLTCSKGDNSTTAVVINQHQELVLNLAIPEKIKKNIDSNIFHNNNFQGLRNPLVDYEITLYKKRKKEVSILFHKQYDYDEWGKVYLINQKINKRLFFNYDKKKIDQYQNEFFKNRKLTTIAIEKEFTNSIHTLFDIGNIPISKIKTLEEGVEYSILVKLTFFEKNILQIDSVWQKIIVFLNRKRISYKTKPFKVINKNIQNQ